ncbi:MAG TPA: TadE/TadG family type IV pilus assembly protein [Azospirillum sp.]|nr:TadE/TadG family type IV pilus assembly protein [Azospirillum sp.]
MIRPHATLWRLARDRGGNVAVEFALLMPLLVIILTGLVDFGRATYERMALETAARSAVQYARQNPNDTAGITAAALNSGGLDATATVEIPAPFCECPDGTSIGCSTVCPSGDPILRFLSVTVRHDFEPFFPYPGLPSPLALAGSAVIRVQ